MRIICPKCGTEYFLESDQLDQEGTPVQCSACEHTFTVFASAQTPRTPRSSEKAAPPPKPPPPQPPRAPRQPALPRSSPVVPPPPPVRSRNASLFLAQGDRVYKVKDTATLQRWIVEKRVLPGDRISPDGKSWDVVSDRADLRPFFALIDQLKATKRALKQKTREMKSVDEAAQSASSIPGTRRDDESTFRPPPEMSASDSISPDSLSRATGDSIAPAAFESGAFDAEPDSELRRASQSMPSTGGPESVPDLPVPDTDSISKVVRDSFFTASAGGMPAAPKQDGGDREVRSDSFYDLDAQQIDDSIDPDRSNSFGRMHAIKTSGEYPPNPTPEADLPAASTSASTSGDSVFDSSFVAGGSASSSIDPSTAAAGQSSESVNFKSTRRVPVRNPTPPPMEVPQNDLRTPTGPTPAVEWRDSRSGAEVDPPGDDSVDPDFDPNQTFSGDEAYVVREGGGAGFYALLLLLMIAIGGGLWYFLAGPGRSMIFDVAVDGPIATASNEDNESPTVAEETTGDGVVDAATPDEATAEPVTAALEPVTAAPEPRPPRPEPSTPRAERPARPTAAESSADLMAKGDRARDRGDFRTAIAEYRKALEGDPKNFRAALQSGWMNVELDRNAAAVSAFKKALALRSSSAEARYGLGLAYQARGQVTQARAEYEKALELEPAGRDAREIRAILSQLD